MFNRPGESHRVWCDGEALNVKWHWLLWGVGQQKKFKESLYYFDSVHIRDQFTYILTRGKAVLPRYLRKDGAYFQLHF